MKTKTEERACLNCNNLFFAPRKELNRGNGKFCSLSCATKHSNQTKFSLREIHCRQCGKLVFTGQSTALYCSKQCKNNFANNKRSFSSKKVITELPCEMCGWKETGRDVHHIVPIRDEGSNELANLISLCPNCHRCADRNLISQEQLRAVVDRRTISSSSVHIEELDAVVVIKET